MTRARAPASTPHATRPARPHCQSREVRLASSAQDSHVGRPKEGVALAVNAEGGPVSTGSSRSGRPPPGAPHDSLKSVAPSPLLSHLILFFGLCHATCHHCLTRMLSPVHPLPPPSLDGNELVRASPTTLVRRQSTLTSSTSVEHRPLHSNTPRSRSHFPEKHSTLLRQRKSAGVKGSVCVPLSLSSPLSHPASRLVHT